jgi:hypothetical protein
MKRRLVWFGLSLMVVVALAINRAPAQEPVPPPIPEPLPAPMPGYVTPPPGYINLPPGQVFVVPTTPYEPAPVPYFPSPITPRPVAPPAKHLATRVLNHYGMGCQYDSFAAVGTFHSEMRWLFGSSRVYFGETCHPPQYHGDWRYYPR